MKLRLLDLFSGIGGFSLGLERTGGFETVAFCEIDKKCRAVLAKHWPGVPQYEDITSLTKERLDADGIAVDAICGGFPCQDLSLAGKGAGLAGARSGLWFEYLRLIEETTPQVVFIENVSALRSRGLEVVLGGLAEIGFDAEWHCIPASAVGAPHQRDRVWIMAYPLRLRDESQRGPLIVPRAAREVEAEGDQRQRGGHPAHGGGEDVPHTSGAGREERNPPPFAGGTRHAARLALALRHSAAREGWRVEPNVGRVADGVPGRVDRLKQLGNAVVPQIPELLGNAYLESIR